MQERPCNNTSLNDNSCNENHQEMNDITFSDKENRPLESVTIQSMFAEGTNMLGNVGRCQLSETENGCVEVGSKACGLTCCEKDDSICIKRLTEVHDLDLNVEEHHASASVAPNANADEAGNLFQKHTPIACEIVENTAHKPFPNSEISTHIEDTLLESTLIDTKVDTKLLERRREDGATPRVSGAVDMTPSTTVKRPSELKVAEKTLELAAEFDEEAVPRRKRVLRNRKESHIRQDSKIRLAERDVLEVCTKSWQRKKSAARQDPVVCSTSDGKRILRRSVRRSSRPSSYKEGVTGH